MSELPKLGSIEVCIKCGNSCVVDVILGGNIIYCFGKELLPSGELIDVNTFQACELLNLDDSFNKIRNKEFMVRTCPDCGYKWKEACANT